MSEELKSKIEFAVKISATTTVRRVRFRSTMCGRPATPAEAETAEARVAPRVHQHERDEADRDANLEGCGDCDHEPRIAAVP